MAAEPAKDKGKGIGAMSDRQIRILFDTLRRIESLVKGNAAAIAANAKAIAKLKEVDRMHDELLDTGRFETAKIDAMVKTHDRALRMAHNKGRNKALLITALPAIAGVVEMVRAIVEHWPF